MDFKSDLRGIIQDEFTAMGISYANADLRELCIHYMNTKMKLIIPQKRIVAVSKEYMAKKQGHQLEVILDSICSKFVHGRDLNQHLSRQILNPDFDDYLLSDWSIHHVHISDSKSNPSDYFYDRSDQLLFVLVRDGFAYFVDIRPHDEQNVFSNKELIEIVDRNWPEITQPFVLDGVVGLTHNCSNDEIRKARKFGVNVSLEINGKVIGSMGMGIMTSGDSLKAALTTNQLFDSLDYWEEYLKENYARIKSDVEKKKQRKFDKVDFRLEMRGNDIVIRETESGLYL